MPPSSPRRLSLQQIVESRRRAAFVGREAELAMFRTNFTLPPEDPRHRFVLHVRGNAGVGKTSLLREWRQAAGEFGALTAAADESADSVPDVLAAFAAQFAEQGRPLKALDRLLTNHRRALREAAGRLAADNESAGPSPGALAAAQAGLLAAGAIPVVGALAGGIDPAVVARGAGGLRAVFGGRARQLEEARLLAEPVQVLTPVFVAELDRVADAVPWVALFLDTYERTAPQLDRWLADLLTPGRYGELPANLVLTLAGQRRLDPAHWGDRGRLVADVPLRPFTEEEARQLLHERGVVAEPVVREVLRLSGGLPVLVSTLAANPGAAGEANATAVERFLAGESDPARRAAALACALPRRFDEDLVAVAVPQDGPHTVPGLYDWLHELPFVAEPYSGRSRYHAVVRAPMLRLQRTGSPQRWKAHDRLAEAFAARRDAAAEGIDPERLWAEQPWRRAALDVLYHRLCARPRTALPEALRAGIEILAQRPSRARHWARTLVDAGEDADNAVLREWGRDLLAAITDHGPRPTAALGLLLTRAELTDRDRAAALVARAWDRFRAGELEAALSDHGRAIAVDPRSERAHQGRAVILRSLGRYEEALADLDRAEEIAPAWAWAVRERGETYRRMGRLEEALTVLDRAHALDPSDAVPLGSRGLVRHVLGRPEEALDDFDRAIALWPEYAWALVRRSRVRTVLGDPVGALADLDRAEELNPGRAGTEGERGEVYRATGRYEEAVACYDRALALDPDYAWAHGSRAAALESLGRIPEARADLDRALELDPGYAWARERRARLGPGGGPSTSGPPAGAPPTDGPSASTPSPGVPSAD